jgi:hypothetical protein
MAITVSISGLSRDVGSRRTHRGNLTTSGTYETGGFAVTSNMFGLGRIEQLRLEVGGGYVAEFVPATSKVKILVGPGFTPAGSVSRPGFQITDDGFASPANSIGITVLTSAGVVTANGAPSVLNLTTNSPVQPPVFTGTPVAAAALSELANASSLAITLAFEAIGV